MPTPNHLHSLTTGVVKVPSTTFKKFFEMVGVDEVYVGWYGMKQYLLPTTQEVLEAINDVPSLHTALDLWMMVREIAG